MNVDEYQRSISSGYRRAQWECVGVLAFLLSSAVGFFAWHTVLQ